MGQSYWLEYKKDKKKVSDYLKERKFPKDKDGKTLIIVSDKGGVDCWLSWHGKRLDIASQVFVDQSAWCAAIARRLIELFGCDRVGAGETGWWKYEKDPGKPFDLFIKTFGRDRKLKNEVKEFKSQQRLFIAEAKRLLP
jgi:hypothetical protein